MKRRNKLLIILLVIVILLVGSIFIGDRMYKSNQELNISNEGYSISVEEGATVQTVVDQLVTDEVVESEFMTKMFLRLNSEYSAVMIGVYTFEKGTTLEEMWTDFSRGQQGEYKQFQIIEGESITVYAQKLALALGDESRSDEILEFWNSSDFVNSVINDYEFITDDILDPLIYYPLEGYFKPDTYLFGEHEFTFENLEFITRYILDGRKADYEAIYNSSNGYNEYTTNFHEVITLASIIEREASSLEDRKIVAGIFINRLAAGDSLGSDITTYYAEQIPIYERDLTQEELDENNGYNTRGSLIGLPVGPVNNPSKDSIDAALNYTSTDYYYFVSDKNGKMYYRKTFSEHEAIITELKENDLWYTWDE